LTRWSGASQSRRLATFLAKSRRASAANKCSCRWAADAASHKYIEKGLVEVLDGRTDSLGSSHRPFLSPLRL
jgi:hypothetical protein